MKYSKYLVYVFLITTLFINCSPSTNQFDPDLHIEKIWKKSFAEVGTFSSIRAVDLTGNGIKDIVFGAGNRELQETDIGVVALDGETGESLWVIPARDEIFGSAAILDITQNGLPDVIIGGRSAILYAINGQTGEIIWEFLPNTDFYEARELGYLNFYNPQIILDQNGDGMPDLLIANGGDVTIPPDDPARPAGKLMVISSMTGEVLAEAEVPDGKETYMSAVIAKLNDLDDDYSIIYGTGGETLGGSLFRTTLSDLMNENLNESIILATSTGKGYIAPPLMADINQDGTLDILVNAVEGTIMAFNGLDNSLIWSRHIENTEAYGSLAIGHFLDRKRLDLFTTYSIGVWPALMETKQILIRGDTGEIMRIDTLGNFQTATPIVADFNNNGYDEALISLNISREEFSGPNSYENMLVIYDFHNYNAYPLTKPLSGANVASTPWIGDLDGNNKLDIIYTRLDENINLFAMNGFKIIRLSSSLETLKEVRWGAYMGSQYNGIFLN